MAEVGVAIRGLAAFHPHTQKREQLPVADVLNSKMITTPLHMLDCAIVSDGAAAFVVTAHPGKKKAVTILGQGYGFTHAYIGEHDHIATTGAVQSGRAAFAMAGAKPADIDVAELYDCFTITVIAEHEDLCFSRKGDSGTLSDARR